jgi:transposase-like protein
MAKNSVQFQKGYSLPKFLKAYGSEEKCREKFFKYRWAGGFQCPQCGHTHYYELKTRQLFQCTQCRHQCSITSGTIFDSSKLPLTTWFLAIYLITQAKEGMSALSLRRFLGISVNAAFKMKHKLQHVMKSADDQLVLEGFVELDDVYWGGKKSGGKRGRGAPGKTPFLAAVSRNEKGHPIHMRMSKIKAFNSSEIKSWSQRHLHADTLVISDAFNPFNCLSNVVGFHGKINASEIYKNPDNRIFHWVNTMISNVKRAINGTYHSISSKHLPRYLAEFCFRFNNRFYIGAMIGKLTKHAANTEPRPLRLLKLAEQEG